MAYADCDVSGHPAIVQHIIQCIDDAKWACLPKQRRVVCHVVNIGPNRGVRVYAACELRSLLGKTACADDEEIKRHVGSMY